MLNFDAATEINDRASDEVGQVNGTGQNMASEYEGREQDYIPVSQLDMFLNVSHNRDDTPEMVEFRAFFRGIGSRHFTADALMVLGPSHHEPGPAFGQNTLPSDDLWNNVIPLVKALDALCDGLGYPVVILSCHRNARYNAAVNGVPGSQHLLFQAADFVARKGSPDDWYNAARDLRDSGQFRGGLGLYDGFVHLDVRGTNVDWAFK